jgi:hypothetical protein
MSREIGYYWVRLEGWSQGEWRVALWNGLDFMTAGIGWPIAENRLQIDECRIVRDETKRGVRKSEKAKRNLHITTVVLRGDRMTDVAKLHGITPTCVRYIVHRTLKRRNPALFKSLASFRPRQMTPSIGDLATHAAEFGFGVQEEVRDGQK